MAVDGRARTDGKEHEIQISLPQGSYVPAFTRRASSPAMRSVPEPHAGVDPVENLSSAQVADNHEKLVPSEPSVIEASDFGSRALRNRTLLYVMAGVVALSLVLFGAVRFYSRSKSSDQLGTVRSLPPSAARPSQQGAAQVPLRLLIGYDGTPRIDSAGEYWESDRYYSGGTAFRRPDAPAGKNQRPDAV